MQQKGNIIKDESSQNQQQTNQVQNKTLNEKRKRASIMQNQIIQVKIEEGEPELKKKIQLNQDFKDIQCIIHMDKFCLQKDLVYGNKIYQCQENLHKGQYICNEAFDKIKSCPLCKVSKDKLKDIDLFHRTILQDEHLQCNFCKEYIQKENAVQHLAEMSFQKIMIFDYLSIDVLKEYKFLIEQFSNELEKLESLQIKDLNKALREKINQHNIYRASFIIGQIQNYEQISIDKFFYKKLHVETSVDEKQCGFQLIFGQNAVVFFVKDPVIEQKKNVRTQLQELYPNMRDAFERGRQNIIIPEIPNNISSESSAISSSIISISDGFEEHFSEISDQNRPNQRVLTDTNLIHDQISDFIEEQNSSHSPEFSLPPQNEILVLTPPQTPPMQPIQPIQANRDSNNVNIFQQYLNDLNSPNDQISDRPSIFSRVRQNNTRQNNNTSRNTNANNINNNRNTNINNRNTTATTNNNNTNTTRNTQNQIINQNRQGLDQALNQIRSTIQTRGRRRILSTRLNN